MRPTRFRLRIAAFAAAAILAAGLSAVSVPAVQAATLHTICSKTVTGFCLESGDKFTVIATDGKYYQYQDTSNGDCLQVNVADTTLTEGVCDQDSHRQFFWYDNATLFVDLAYNTEAYVVIVHMHGFEVAEVYMGAFGGNQANDAWSIN
jgi:hypothetical protein